MTSLGGGFLLVGADRLPIYVNDDAVAILAFPKRPETIKSLDNFLAEKIPVLLPIDKAVLESGFITHLQSGRRRYVCRAFPLNGSSNGARHATIAILMERGGKFDLDTDTWADKFHLTQRECETVNYLLQGFTNKEIATRMKISPNTVKAFIRLIMVKMGASTRSGIIGKLLETAPAPKSDRATTTRSPLV